jgi:membrane protein implicated in regulation of membrane protease activity
VDSRPVANDDPRRDHARITFDHIIDRAHRGDAVLTYLYIFTLIVGAVLLGASILLGGQDGDVDADGDVDLDVDAGADVDAGGALGSDFGSDVGSDFGSELGKDFGKDWDPGPGGGDLGGFLTMFLSMRFWVFFLAFFGLTGLTFDLLDLVSSPWITLALALGMGLGVGTAARLVMRKIGGDTSGNVTESRQYVGKTARVMVPFDGQGVGRVRVEVKGTTVDLLASGIEEDDYGSREEVLIVEMDGHRARVARVNGARGRSE